MVREVDETVVKVSGNSVVVDSLDDNSILCLS